MISQSIYLAISKLNEVFQDAVGQYITIIFFIFQKESIQESFSKKLFTFSLKFIIFV
jgi:hypothetical protein